MSNFVTDLDNFDWDFDNSPSTRNIHTIHPYPAKFIPQIPEQIIRNYYPGFDSVIFDPFCGSGTALLEANKFGIDAWGVDLHPLACLISKVKTTPIPGGFNSLVDPIIQNARMRILNEEFIIPDLPNIDHWFTYEVQKALSVLISEIDKVDDENIKNALRVSLSSIIVQVSNQESDTRYAAKENNIIFEDVFLRYSRAANNVSKAVKGIGDNLFVKFGQTQIINKDILKVSADELPKNVGLVITSPPYPNAYEYWLYHKYRMYWLGMDPIAVKKNEIGARPHYFKKNHQDEQDFETQMEQCFGLISQILIPDGKVFFLVGRSIIHGRTIDNLALLKRAASFHGFRVEDVAERKIKSSRKSFSHGNIKKEHLVVFGFNKK